MKCRICGCTTPTGTKLCKDCAAARKRAFAATVTQPLLLAAAGAPSVTRPRFAPKPVKPRVGSAPAGKPSAPPVDRGPSSPAISPLAPKAAAERRTPAAVRRSPSRRSSFLWLFLAIFAGLVVLLLVGMFVAREGRGPGAGEPSDEVTSAPAAPAPATASEAHVQTTPAASSAGLTADGLVTEVTPPPTVRKTRKPPAPAEVKTALPEPEPAVVVEPPPQPVAPPPRVVPPVRVDPLQKLNEALARCAREDLLDRMSCEQNARAQLCGDSWGQIPQCPIGRGNDHGQ